MSGYARPSVVVETYFDDDGEVIRYGDRWSEFEDGPPGESYSVAAHPDRFIAGDQVARALIAHLVRSYEVQFEKVSAPGPARETIRLSPGDVAAAPMTFALRAGRGVGVDAGVLCSEDFPDCGCDACDDDVLDVIEDLERFVFAIVQGRLSESIGRGRRPVVNARVDFPDGLSERRGREEFRSRAELDELRQRLPPGTWKAWTER